MPHGSRRFSRGSSFLPSSAGALRTRRNPLATSGPVHELAVSRLLSRKARGSVSGTDAQTPGETRPGATRARGDRHVNPQRSHTGTSRRGGSVLLFVEWLDGPGPQTPSPFGDSKADAVHQVERHDRPGKPKHTDTGPFPGHSRWVPLFQGGPQTPVGLHDAESITPRQTDVTASLAGREGANREKA